MRETLERGLPALGLGTDLIPRLESFAGLVLERNRVMNLTRITEPGAFAALHLLDSLALLPLAGLEKERVIDVGCGAGFPGVPLAIGGKGLRVTLLDSLGKRVDFLRGVCGELGLANAECVHARAEEFAAGGRERFDAAVSRAVAPLPMLCELCLPLVKTGGVLLAMKAAGVREELEGAKRAIALLGGGDAEILPYTVPGAEVPRAVVRIRKVSPTPGKYPRRFAAIKKQPL